jgi:riboflavin kinase/FMN adenylyltransferase
MVLTIGTYDGVHRGHQLLLSQIVRRAHETGRLSGVLSFHPHPRSVLYPDANVPYLSTPEERAAIMERLGLDLLVLLPFTREFADTPAEPLMKMLVQHLRLRELWVGADFAMARNREGNVQRLAELGRALGYDLHAIEPLAEADRTISSTRIRALLADGRVDQAARMLGRYYSVSGPVIHGAARGRRLGFRTANVTVPPERAMPANGIYAVWMIIDGVRHAGAANVGIRPSFDSGEKLLEVHLLDYDGDLYGREVTTEFVEYIREERRFDDVEALRRQVQQDIVEIRTLLSSVGMPEGADESGRASAL